MLRFPVGRMIRNKTPGQGISGQHIPVLFSTLLTPVFDASGGCTVTGVAFQAPELGLWLLAAPVLPACGIHRTG